MTRSIRNTCLLAALFTGAVTAQEPAPTAPTVPPAGQPKVTARQWSLAESHRLFRGCDRDADDQLDLFEAADCIELLSDLDNRGRFARLDGNRSGFLEWNEFDRLFRDLVQHGEALQVKPCRPLPEATPQAAGGKEPAAPGATPQQRWLRLFDEDGDGELSADEMGKLLDKAKLPRTLMVQLQALDRDRSQTLSPAELEPLLAQAQARLPQLFRDKTQSGSLPTPWSTWDQDGDGALDVRELAQALRQVDPGLARWAAELLTGLDQNRDGVLSAAELMPAGAGPGKPMVIDGPAR